jgi:hypothetical protein
MCIAPMKKITPLVHVGAGGTNVLTTSTPLGRSSAEALVALITLSVQVKYTRA